MLDQNLAISAIGLRKQYGKAVPALDGFDLHVPYGTVHGLLGPNGAGKSTAVRILTTLLRADEGAASVAGHNVFSESQDVRRRIGLVGQSAAVDEILSGRQNLVLFGRLFHLSSIKAKQRADELLEQFGLTDAANKTAKSYSGGMRRRLDLAASLIMAPPVLFLDEPTTGLDPRSRIEGWDSVRSLVRNGTTVLLTTQYFEEVDQLAKTISVINKGKTIAEGTSIELKSIIGGDRIEVVAVRADDVLRLNDLLTRITGGSTEVDVVARKVSAPVSGMTSALTDVFAAVTREGIAIEDLVTCPGQRWTGKVEVFRQAGWRQVSMTIHWERDTISPWVLISDEPDGARRVRLYRRRMRAEATSQDCKQRGFNLERSKLTDVDRFDRLLLAIHLAYWWVEQLGWRVIRTGQRRHYDRRERRDLRVLRLGRLRLLDLLAHATCPPLPFRHTHGSWRFTWLA